MTWLTWNARCLAITAAISLATAACGGEQDGALSGGADGGAGATTGSGAATAGVGGSPGSGAGGAGGVGGSGGAIVINEGFIGGPCTMDEECDYDGGFCLTEAEGFPDGMCSLDCSQFCPDQDNAVTTFCTDPDALGTTGAEGLCTTRCDYGQSPTGCRTGYQCQALSRYSEPETLVYACVPGDDDPFELSACHEELLALGVAFSPAVNPMDSPDEHPNLICDIEDPIWIEPVLHTIAFRPSSLDNDPATMFTACPHGLALVDAAEVLANNGGTDLVHYGIYNCRVISGTSTLSEHGLANAIDIAAIKYDDGNYHTVLDDWEKDQPNPTTEAGQRLKSFVQTLYDDFIYNIILTPDYNAAHADHFHCDLTEGSHFLE